MSNAFSNFQGFVDKPNRNFFDLSFRNNLTCNFGTLYPVFCKEVIPGDSFRIKPTFGFRTVPMVFPIQTPINVNLHFFYVRNRNLWCDWQNFIGNLPLESTQGFPYIQQPNSFFTTGSLSDYLGIPTTVVGSFGTSFKSRLYINPNQTLNPPIYPLVQYSELSLSNHVFLQNLSSLDNATTSMITQGTSQPLRNSSIFVGKDTGSASYTPAFYCDFGENYNSFIFSKGINISWSSPFDVTTDFTSCTFFLCVFYYDRYGSPRGFKAPGSLTLKDGVFNFFVSPEYSLLIQKILNSQNGLDYHPGFTVCCSDNPKTPVGNYDLTWIPFDFVTFGLQNYEEVDATELSSLPFAADANDEVPLPISALPFRAYESIYNSFYRNVQNDPFILRGKPVYNKYIPSDEGGLDRWPYQLHKRNWEKDFLTSAVQSPQQGAAPLVGVSSSGTFTFQNEDGETYTAKAVIGEDGHTLTGIETMSPELSVNGTARQLVDLISHGISINDFRNVNAFQRWLETNIRRGYRYKDQLMSHFGVDPSYAALDMPEFIGGISRPLQVNTITQTVETEIDPLGSFAGNGVAFGEGIDITKYCDEHGFIIGILSVVPVPCYSQLLPKHFLKHNLLDYYFPEFANIGLQPITYCEVSPLQSYMQQQGQTNTHSVFDTFGYQRAWYDYLASTDEIHGLFRTSLRNFVMNRTFNGIPQLGKKFLQIDSEQLNQVFADTDDTDKILGVIDFKVEATRPIPKYGIPKLE